MAITVQELVQQFKQLDKVHQQEALALMQRVAKEEAANFDWDQWLADMHAIQASIKAQFGDDYIVGSQALLDEIREERS